MAKKKKDQDVVPELVPGTVEYERAQFFAREKAAYEERTGETVAFELDTPLTSTPLPVIPEPVEETSEEAAGSDDAEITPAEGESE